MGFFDKWSGKAIKLTDGSFWRGFFGLGTTSGKSVNYDTALALDTVWACVNLRANMIGTLPCIVYEKDGYTVADEHDLYDLLHNLPNLDDTAPDFWKMCSMSLDLDGNFFAEKKMSGKRLVALNPLHPLTVDVCRNDRNDRYYEVSEDGKKRRIPEDRMLHVRSTVLPGVDRGLSPIRVACNTFGNAIAAEETAGKMFANGMQVSGVLTADQILKPEQRKQLGDVLSQFAGSDRAGKIAVIEGGMQYQQLSINPQDAQMLETRQFSVEQICRIFGVPPVMIGHAANGTTAWGSGIEQLILQFTKSGLRPMLKSIESSIYRDLLDVEGRRKFKIEFNLEGLLRGDSAARAEFYSKMVQNGIYTRNHARKLENLPRVDGADELTAQINLAPLAQLGGLPAERHAQPAAAE